MGNCSRARRMTIGGYDPALRETAWVPAFARMSGGGVMSAARGAGGTTEHVKRPLRGDGGDLGRPPMGGSLNGEERLHCDGSASPVRVHLGLGEGSRIVLGLGMTEAYSHDFRPIDREITGKVGDREIVLSGTAVLGPLDSQISARMDDVEVTVVFVHSESPPRAEFERFSAHDVRIVVSGRLPSSWVYWDFPNLAIYDKQVLHMSMMTFALNFPQIVRQVSYTFTTSTSLLTAALSRDDAA